MTGRDRDRYDRLKAHIAGMADSEYRRELDKTRNPRAVFDLIREGDAVGVACAVRDGRSMEIQDDRGMTPLHHAAAYDTRLIGQALTERPNAAPWTRDSEGRLPLDVAREAGHHELGDRLERLTYPELYRDERDGPVREDLIEGYDARRRELGSPDTRPDFARDFPARGMLPGRGDRDRGDRER
jgi:hypothetical protein